MLDYDDLMVRWWFRLLNFRSFI